MTGDCNTDTFFVNAGQTDFNINTDFQYTIPEDVTTTDTYLDSQTYEIVEFGNLAWPTSAVCFGPPPGTLMLRELGSAGA